MKTIYVIIRDTFPTNEIINNENLKNKRVLNPYDEYALFEAIKIKEKIKGHIVCIYLSNDNSGYGLRTALGLGADEGILVKCDKRDEKYAGDIIANLLKERQFEYICVGIRDVNDDREELPARLSYKLEKQLYSHVLSIEDILSSEEVIISVERDKTIDTIEVKSNSIIAFGKNNYEPQYPTIENILNIKNKKIEFYEDENEKKYKVYYHDNCRKREIYKKIDIENGCDKIIEYMKKWRIIE